MITIRLCAILLLFPLRAFCQSPPDSSQITLMSFNVRYGTADDGDNSWALRMPILIDLLREESPDILSTQEAVRFQLDDIRESLSLYGESGVGRDDGATEGEYCAILYRNDRFNVLEEGTFWFSDRPDEPGSATWGNTYPRICTWVHLMDALTGRAFFVYNVHLDHESDRSRRRSVATLAVRIAARTQKDPFIVTGDFNAGEQDSVMQFMRGELGGAGGLKLADSFRMVHPKEQPAGTYHAFLGEPVGEKIDYILVQPGTRVLKAAILRFNNEGRYPSDHFPVAATVVLPPAPVR